MKFTHLLAVGAGGVGLYYLLKPKAVASPTPAKTVLGTVTTTKMVAAIKKNVVGGLVASQLSIVGRADAAGFALKYTNTSTDCKSAVVTIAWAPTLEALHKAALAKKLKYGGTAGWVDPFGCVPVAGDPVYGWCISADGLTVAKCPVSTKSVNGFGNIDAITVPPASRSAYYTRTGTR